MDLYGSRDLTAKERAIVKLVTEGQSNRQIAPQLGVSCVSLKKRLSVIFDKTGMGNRLELALWQMSRERGVTVE